VFAISSGSVHTETDVATEIAAAVAAALSAAGYEGVVAGAAEGTTSAGTVMTVELTELYFRNYNYMFRFVPTWGAIGVTLTLTDASGKMLFQQDFKANGNSFCLRGHCAFSNATRETMTRLLNQIANACASDAFAALISAPSVRPEM
jgi:hypothetical protein